jgi:hypothetical protein
LTVLAPHPVDGAVAEDYRSALSGDAGLVELTSWASFAAAREVGSWTPGAADRTPGEDTGRRLSQAGVEPHRSEPVDPLANGPFSGGRDAGVTDLAVTATGPDAERWLDIARAERGPAGPGRRPGQFSAVPQR